MKMIKLKNCGKDTYRFEIGLLPGQPPMKYEVAPGETCEVPAGYCQSAPGAKSMIERRAPLLKPLDDCPPEPAPAPEPQPTPASPKAVSSESLFTEPLKVEEKPKKKWAKARKAKK